MAATELLTYEAIEKRVLEEEKIAPSRVMFRPESIYGFGKSIQLPISRTESIDSGPITLTSDPLSEPNWNCGVIDFAESKITVRYGVQVVFPGMYDLISKGNYEPQLLNPIRITATDNCALTSDTRRWQALGCLEFLPGSIWSGAKGG